MEFHFANWYLRSCVPVVTVEHSLTFQEGKAQSWAHLTKESRLHSSRVGPFVNLVHSAGFLNVGPFPSKSRTLQYNCVVMSETSVGTLIFSLIQAAEEKWRFKNCCLLAK